MSDARHTPGPWVKHTVDVGGTDAWDVSAMDGAITLACPPTEYDADLIAAAPELLDVCEVMLARLDYLHRLWGQEGISSRMADELRKVIAKAKGESQ